MTYQLFITHYRSDSNDTRLWMYARILLSLLFFTTLGAVFKFGLLLSVANVIGCIIFLIATIRYYNKTHRIPFVQIQNNTLNYFCPQQEEMISISARDITKISTRFCELQLHTPERIHSLNMGLIRQEQTRWEIKEMIRRMAQKHELKNESMNWANSPELLAYEKNKEHKLPESPETEGRIKKNALKNAHKLPIHK